MSALDDSLDVRQAERLIGTALDSMQDVSMLLFDRELRVTAAHGGAAGRHGYSASGMIGRKLSEILPAPAWITWAPFYAKALAGESATRAGTLLDGTAAYETTFRPIVVDGAVVGGTALTRDLSAPEPALRDLRLLAEGASDCMMRSTVDGVLLYASPAMHEVYGLSPEATVGRRDWLVVHPEDAGDLQTARARHLTDGRPYTTIVRVRHADGHWRWIETRTRSIVGENTRRVVEIHASSRDVTARHESTLALLASERAFRLLVETSTHAITRWGVDGRCLYASSAVMTVFGTPPEAWLGQPLTLNVHEDDLPRVAAVRAEIEATMQPRRWQLRVRHADGRWLWVELDLRPVVDPRTGEIVELHASGRDVTERRRSEELRTRWELSWRHTRHGIAVTDLGTGRIEAVNDAFAALHGRTVDELVGTEVSALRCDAHTPDDDADVLHDLRTKGVARFEAEHTVADGTTLPVEVESVGVSDARGELAWRLDYVLDLTARRLQERATAERDAARELFEKAFATSPVGMSISRSLGGDRTEVLQCNRALADMLGYEPEELLTLDKGLVFSAEDTLIRGTYLREAFATGRGAQIEVRLRHRDGHDVWTLLAPSVVTDAEGDALLVMQYVDISARHRYEADLQHLVDHDELTGLMSRRRFQQELRDEAARVADERRPSAVVLLDLDGFKDVNDTFGHLTGDKLLARIGAGLRADLGAGDILARIGGDEFAVILPARTAAQAEGVARRLVETVSRSGRIVQGGRHAEVTTSVGLTIVDPDDDRDAERLMAEADIALYEAKGAGRNRVRVYDRSAGLREALAQRTDWIGHLRRGSHDERFVLHAQPVVALGAGSAVPGRERYELLLRLRDDDGNLTPPSPFLAHAEREGLIGGVDRWVLAKAVALLHEAHQQGRDLHLAVNLSGHTLQDPTIAPYLSILLGHQPIRRGTLTVEITETAAITNLARAGDLARQLRELGCLLALDDFGAGFASFYYLKHLVFDVLKIDGDFVDSLPHSPTDRLVVEAVVGVANGLGVQVVAERVTDQETADLLEALGVGFAQGYFFGRPAPLPPGRPAG